MACTCREGGLSKDGTGAKLPAGQRRVGIAPQQGCGGGGSGRQGWYLVGGVAVPHDQLPILRGTYQQPGERASHITQASPSRLPHSRSRPPILGSPQSLTWSQWPSAWHRSWPGAPLMSAASASGLVPPPLGQTPAAERGALNIGVSRLHARMSVTDLYEFLLCARLQVRPPALEK